jgi:hypothetical protein
MNSKRFILLSCVMPCVFAVSPATAQMGGHGTSMAGMPMQRGPMLHSTSGFHRFNPGDFRRDDRFGRFHHFNRIIVFDNFGSPFVPFYYPPPCYPYPYYRYTYGGY